MFGEVPSYEYDTTSGILKINNSAEPLSYIKILLTNIRSYKDRAIQKANGDTNAIDVINSLGEKAEYLEKVMAKYNNDVYTSLTKGHTKAPTIPEFIEVLKNTWLGIQAEAIKSTAALPITNAKTETEINLQIEELQRQMKKDQKINNAQQEANELNLNITKQQYDFTNKLVTTHVEGATTAAASGVTSIIKPLVNASGEVLVDLGQTVGNVMEMGGFMSGIRQILIFGLIGFSVFGLAYTAVVCCPLVKAVVSRRTRRINAEDIVRPPVENPIPPVENPRPPLSLIPPSTPQLRNYPPLSEPRGGKKKIVTHKRKHASKKYTKRLNKKKHVKKTTRKLKRNLGRKTKSK